MEVVLCSNPITAEEEKLWQILRLNTDLIMSRWSEFCPQVTVVGGWCKPCLLLFTTTVPLILSSLDSLAN